MSVESKRSTEVEALMNVQEVCSILGCKKSKLYVLIGNAELESVKLRGARLFRPEAVRDCIRRHADRGTKRRRSR
jgi:excisionase family DNA binding protein